MVKFLKYTLFVVILLEFIRCSSSCTRDDSATNTTQKKVITKTRDEKTGIVTDTRRYLMWQDNAIGTKTTLNDARKKCENLTLGNYKDWRLPELYELATIIDKSRRPAISSVFVYTNHEFYWSTSPSAYFPDDFVSTIKFWNGRFSRDDKEKAKCFSRCVRRIPF